MNPLSIRTSVPVLHLSCRPPLSAEKDGAAQATTELAGEGVLWRHIWLDIYIYTYYIYYINIYRPGKIQKMGDPYLSYVFWDSCRGSPWFPLAIAGDRGTTMLEDLYRIWNWTISKQKKGYCRYSSIIIRLKCGYGAICIASTFSQVCCSWKRAEQVKCWRFESLGDSNHTHAHRRWDEIVKMGSPNKVAAFSHLRNLIGDVKKRLV